MLAFEFDKGNLKKLTIAGELKDIASETTCMLHVIYSKIKKSNKQAGEIFKAYLEFAIKCGIIFCDDDEREKNKKKENDRDFVEGIEQMLQELKRKK